MPWRALPTSFAAKIRLALAVVATVSIVLVCAILLPLDYRQNRGLALDALATHSEIIAIHSGAALRFGDREAGAETLAALKAVPEIGVAMLIDEFGDPFATYRRAGVPAPQLDTAADPVQTTERWLVRREPILENGRQLGTLVVAYDLTAITDRLVRDMLIAIAVALGCVVAASGLAVRFRRVLYQPIAELSRTASQIGETQDYSVRARVLGDDEFGRLTDAFNRMLDRIEEQQDEISAANTELKARNHEMEQFVYTVSHDLKSPLVTITGFVGLLRQDVEDGRTDGVLEATVHLSRAASKMSELIDDLLQLSRIGRVANEWQEVDTDSLVRDLVDEMGERLRAAGAEVELLGPLPKVWADRLRLTQVFENLLSNALKYGCTAESPCVTIGSEVTDKEIRYFVRDNGPGVAPEYRERIWGLFQRLDGSAEGTGVGLAIVARILDVHGGRAWLDPAPPPGATFWIALSARPPRWAGLAQAPTKDSRGTTPAPVPARRG